ncbi:hypothetical protein B0A48_06761 [Cryoendolithus antarcticus]|uniref:FAD dependent oxidoreductase domain-containing protein n=1 Tax=Cryoendolithus antarcticus TaxID=1507870 RepID=A0A1V8T9Q7_9PEZI|nr:hypothetical protein B0A48_06761 [Cryoendolithus antarcticus]
MAGDDYIADPGLPHPAPTESYWQCPPHALASHQSAQLPTEASVVIIGSGITGTSVAYHLLQRNPHLQVVIVEARTITSGATGRNGGHCKDVSFKTYRQTRERIGRDAAMRLVNFRRSHVDETRRLAQEVHDEGFGEAQFRDVQSLTAVYDQGIFEGFKDGLEALLEDFPEWRDQYSIINGHESHEKHGMPGAHGIIASPAAALWPYRLITGSLERLLSKHKSFSLEAQTPVLSISANDVPSHPYLVRTPRGTIRTQHVVHCTNGHASHLLPALASKIIPVRGQMSVQTPSSELPRLGHSYSWSLCWPGGGFDYMTQAGDAEGLVFLGGGAQQAKEVGVVELGVTDDSALNKPGLAHLCSILPNHFEAAEGTTLKQAWTGVMGFTPDAFPLVGKVPQELTPTKLSIGAAGNEWIAAGFSGYGMVHCWQSGRALADMISGQPQDTIDEYFPTEQFALSRKRLEGMNLETLRAFFVPNPPEIPRSHLETESPHEHQQSLLLSRIITNVEKLNEAVMVLNKSLQEINVQNMNVELVAQMFKNYQSNVLFHLEATDSLKDSTSMARAAEGDD